MRGGRRGATAAVFLVAFFVHYQSPVRQYGDSEYSLLLAENLLRGGGFTLDRYFERPLDPGRYPGLRDDGLPYQVMEARGHVHYAFPPGSSLLSVPFVALARLAGYSAIAPDGGYHAEGEHKIERRLAALLAAAVAAMAFLSARRLLAAEEAPAGVRNRARGLALVAALGLSFGSPAWSTASRALWSHTWALLLGMLAVHLLVRWRATGRPGPILLGTLLGSLLAWGFFTRPTGGLGLLGVAAWLALRARPLGGAGGDAAAGRALAAFAGAAGIWLALFAGWSLYHFGALVPPYFGLARLSLEDFGPALAGSLVSPSRGLLVFLPALLFVGVLALRHRRWLPFPDLALLGAGVGLAHLPVIASFPHWWGGHSYGPRLATEALPWFYLLAIVALAGWSREAGRARSATRRRIEAGAGLALLALSVALHAAGALSRRTNLWNRHPVNVDTAPERIWDWGDPQFLAWRRPRGPAAPEAGEQ